MTFVKLDTSSFDEKFPILNVNVFPTFYGLLTIKGRFYMKLERIKLIVVCTLLTLSIAGCGDSTKTASKANFEKVLNDHFEKNCLAITTKALNFPYTFDPMVYASLGVEKGMDEVHKGFKALSPLFALVDVGLLTSKKKEATYTFTLTPKGEQFYQAPNKFSIGTAKVDTIESFSEPSQANGYTVCEVNFIYSLYTPHEWAKNYTVRSEFPDLSRNYTKQKGSATLVLMNYGWMLKGISVR